MRFRAASLLSLVPLIFSQAQTNSVSALLRLVHFVGTVKGFPKTACIILVFFATVIASPAQTFKHLASFDSSNGFGPQSLVQGTDGSFYGTTFWGGSLPCINSEGCGTVFKITAGGKLTVLHEFGGSDGYGPNAPLVQGTDGSFYGTTGSGGTSTACSIGCGTVFKILPNGSFLTLHNFDGTDGQYPGGGLVQGTEGNFYGTASSGGPDFEGTVFKITPRGRLTTLHSFDFADGYVPVGALVQGTDGSFYGTTLAGGTNPDCGDRGCGTVFKISSGGSFLSLHNFDSADGANPIGGLVQALDGKFYGTTESGGANGYGTVFKITSGGVLTTLYSFCVPYCAAGTGASGLVQATDGNFYGTTQSGGTNTQGTVFKITSITSEDVLTTLYNFCSQSNCSDGRVPQWPPLQATDGNFYGTTQSGGNDTACVSGCGTVFSISVGLAPFVKTQPTSGKVGAAVKILGTELTGATSVTFNGTVAKFTVVSKSEIKTTVPEGATTGKVEVKTPHDTLKSNVVFRASK